MKRDATVRLCITDENGDEVWLNAFTEQINKLLEGTEVTLKSNIDDIEEAFMNVPQAMLRYNTQNKNITGIVAFKEEEV